MDTVKLTGNLVKIPTNGETVTIDNKYNGWTNKETWLVNVWLNNDYDLYKYYLGRLKDNCNPKSSSCVRDVVYELREIVWEIYREEHREFGLINDLIETSLNNVDWSRLAEHYIEEIQEEIGKE